MALPNIVFAEGDARTLAATWKAFYEALRRAGGEPNYTLSDGDPMRLISFSEAALLAQVNTDIDATGKGNLLYYAGEETIEHLGLLYGKRGARLQPSAALTTLRYTLSAVRGTTTTIPAGSRVTADNKLFFATVDPLEIPSGELEGEVQAVCLTVGEQGNGFAIGEIRNMVDLNPFVASAVNITESAGGADLEDIESYRARIQLLPESFSVAGPDGAYEFWAKTANSDIADVAVWSPSPGEVNVVPLMNGGEIPTQDILDEINDVLNDRTIRPLTDYVKVLTPRPNEYSINLEYRIWMDDSGNSVAIQAAVDQAIADYIEWQSAKLGRDINPSVLHKMIMQAGVKRAEISEPVFTPLEQDEVAAIINPPEVTYGGLEDA